jgi:hypothetical protein
MCLSISLSISLSIGLAIGLAIGLCLFIIFGETYLGKYKVLTGLFCRMVLRFNAVLDRDKTLYTLCFLLLLYGFVVSTAHPSGETATSDIEWSVHNPEHFLTGLFEWGGSATTSHTSQSWVDISTQTVAWLWVFARSLQGHISPELVKGRKNVFRLRVSKRENGARVL